MAGRAADDPVGAEPTRGVDVGAKARSTCLLRELARQGVGVLMVSSELPEIRGMSDRVLVMHEAASPACCPAPTITEERIMAHASGFAVQPQYRS